MANLKTIRKRITSVKNTQKITRAMKMVAAAKLRRAQNALMAARPFAEQLKDTLLRLVAAADAWDHPLLKKLESPQKASVLVLTSDRGLCGGFNSNLLRTVSNYITHELKDFAEVDLSTMGRKGRDYYKARKIELKMAESLDQDNFDFGRARDWAETWLKAWQDGEFEVFYLGYNSFQSAISQVPTLRQIFPLELQAEAGDIGPPVVWEGEPGPIIDGMIQRLIAQFFFLAVLESNASELGARMSAMENATNNANEMIGSLTLQYNRARQAAITTELMDIVNGAESLGK